jgi:hypothetical protein
LVRSTFEFSSLLGREGTPSPKIVLEIKVISKTRHNEKSTSGKFVYIVEAHVRDQNTGKITESNPINTEYSGSSKYDVLFRNGVGRCTSRLKAQMLSEQFEYIIKIHKDDKPWEEAKPGKPVTVSFEDEDYDAIDETEPGDDED